MARGDDGRLLAGARETVVVDTCNSGPRQRDGCIEPIEAGTPESQWLADQLDHSVVKAFNNIYAQQLLEKACRRRRPDASRCLSRATIRHSRP